jgi:hypothetical protein
MKKIDTLVEDIYDLFTDASSVDKDDLKLSARQLSRAITNHVVNRLLESKQPKRKRTLRMSQVGKPLRQLWYDLKEYPVNEKPLPHNQIKFLYGNILEELLLFLAKAAGHTVEEEQKKVELDGVRGHKDCRIDGVTVDVKSASSYSFKKFESNTVGQDDPFGYISQLSGYAQAEGDREAAFLAIDKQNGKLALSPLHELEFDNVSQRIGKIRKALDSDIPPERCYSDVPEGKTGNRKLSIGCSYCPYKFFCWSDINEGRGLRTFRYANGPRFFTRIVKQPNVEEIPSGMTNEN